MDITITINCDNAAFFDDEDVSMPGSEVARILRGYADDVDGEGACHETSLRDINGNKVGKVTVSE